MLASQGRLTERQINSFNSFLVDGTGRALRALENVFGLVIESSDSSLEIAPATESEFLKHLGSGKLYTVSSDIGGDLQGQILLLMRSGDFKCLGEVMKPVLSLLFLSDPDADLTELDSRKPDWMKDAEEEDESFHEQMMDTLAEMGNVLIGLYIKSIYRLCELNSDHSVPRAQEDPEQRKIRQALSSELPDQLHVVIENEFVVMDKPIKLWCVISPTHESFTDILSRIEGSGENTQVQ